MEEAERTQEEGAPTRSEVVSTATAVNKKLVLCRRFKDSSGILRNYNSLPLFVYATSPSTHAVSADGVGVTKEATAAVAAASIKNDFNELALCTTNNSDGIGRAAIISAMDCLPLNGNAHHHVMTPPSGSVANGVGGSGGGGGGGVSTVAVLGAGGVSYQHHLNLHHHSHHLLGHHSPYSNNYPLHHSGSQNHIHSDQTKSLQELQHEVGALLEFRDLVIETFPDLKHKMASMSSSASSAIAVGGGTSVTNTSVSGTNTLTGGMSNSSIVSRREWEPGIRLKRKVSQKEPSTVTVAASSATPNGTGAAAAGELSSSSLTRSRSNSHSGKKEPKSGENNNGSVVQDSGFSTETSSSKEGHSASSTNGAITGPIASNRLSCPESDDELLNLLDVIHRKSNRLREEMEHLQNYERQNLRGNTASAAGIGTGTELATVNESETAVAKSSCGSSTASGLTPKTFREHVERLNKEDIKQLRKERDRLLDKLAEMEAETLTGRIKAAKMSDQVEELINVKKDLEEQLKLAMAQRLELSSRVQQLQQQQQQQQLQSKSSSSQSDYSSQRNFLSSATTVLSTGSGASQVESSPQEYPQQQQQQQKQQQQQQTIRRQNTFQPVVVEQQPEESTQLAFHQSVGSDSKHQQQQQQQQQQLQIGRLDGIVSTPGGRNARCRVTDSKRFAAILLETNVLELQRHLLTLTVQNQVLMQKLEQASKFKTHLAKRLDKSKDDVEDLRFQLEEKNIELEGTKAQLRVLESRIHSSTPISGAATNSYLHSQNDYETNRSSASTTLMVSRRGISGQDSHHSDMRSNTSNSSQPHAGQTTSQMPMPMPALSQISTPSMKAMVHLAMDEMQHHSSSTESAHDHELQQELQQSVGSGSGNGSGGGVGANKIMSASVGGVSPFDNLRMSPRGQQAVKKLGTGSAVSKPSKIPLPGSKTISYFSGKPPSGRPSTAGRSPSSANTSACSTSSSKSSLSRSTGNLLYSKSPNSLKRTDSAQSIRKENSSSFSTNTSRSSTSSIPMAITPYVSSSKSPAASTGTGTGIIPSARVLQNSPLPKLKRESLTSRVRHLDSLSRAHQNQNQNQNQQQPQKSNGHVDVSSPTSPSPSTPPGRSNASSPNMNGSYLISSTPKPSSIAAQLNWTVRKDGQLNSSSSFSNGSQQFLRRATGGCGGGVGGAPTTTMSSTSTSTVNNNATTRRFSSASVVGARIAGRNQEHQLQNGSADHNQHHHQHQHQHQQQNNGTNSASVSDSDSGKVRSLKSTFLGWLKI